MGIDVCLRFSVFLVVLRNSAAYVKCGDWICYGTGAYCCEYALDSCCYYLWSFWWFWMAWLLLFTLLITCGFWCRRRYRTRREYILVRGPDGVIQTAQHGTVTMYGTVEGATAVPPVAPAKPPAYTDQKPPSYTTVPS